jgi:hypothetical protein
MKQLEHAMKLLTGYMSHTRVLEDGARAAREAIDITTASVL